MEKSNKKAIQKIIKNLRENGIDYEQYDDLLVMCNVGFVEDVQCKYEYKYYADYVKDVALKEVTRDAIHADLWRNLYWDAVKLCALWFFEDFLIYMEKKRPFSKKFYEPRKKTLKTVVNDLQKIEDSKNYQMYGLSLPARTGKSTLIIFFIAWICLKRPESHNAVGTHSGILASHFYKEFLDLFETPEYTYQELYEFCNPGKVYIADKSAEHLTISFASKGDFPSITCRGIDGTWTGAVDISDGGYLCVDDLVRDREHSLSPARMDNTFAEYLNKMVDRRNEGSKEIMIGTLWNVLDPLMRLQDMYGNDSRYLFRRIPALNENDESNFDYEIKGFSTKYYLDMREKMSLSGQQAEWMAKFQQQPYVREGILFPTNELGFFNGILPQDHQFEYQVVCDVAFGGGDSVSMPVALQDKETGILYVIDWYFSNQGVKVTVPEVVDMIIKHGVMVVQFEKNNGGQMYADKVQAELESRNYICSCSTKPAPNAISKVDKIKSCEPDIKTRVKFLDSRDVNISDLGEITCYKRSVMYNNAIQELSTFVTLGKNIHDDAADSIAQLCLKAFNTYGSAQVEVIDRAFLGF